MAVIIYVSCPAARKVVGPISDGTVGKKVANDALVSSAGTGPPCLESSEQQGRKSGSLGFRAAIFGGGITVIGRTGGPDLQEEAPIAANETVAIGDS